MSPVLRPKALVLRADFMERMEFKYGEEARQAGCYVVSAAGFDSVPADVGALWTANKFVAAGGTPSAIESFLTFHSTGSFKGAALPFTLQIWDWQHQVATAPVLLFA